MLRKTNCTMDVHPIFNKKLQGHVFSHEVPEKILLRSRSCEVFAVRFFFSNFHLKCRLPVLTWVVPSVSKDLSRHPGTPQKILIVCSPFRHPWPCLLLIRLVDASVGCRECTELPPGRLWSRWGAGWKWGAVSTSISCFLASGLVAACVGELCCLH